MTLASCAPEGTFTRFQNSSPRAAPRGGGRPPRSPASPGSLSSLGPLLHPSRFARRARFLLDTFSPPLFNQTQSDGTEQAPGTRNTARATTREQAEPHGPAPPPTRARLAETPTAHAGHRKSWGPRGLPGMRGRPAPAPLAPVWASEQTRRPLPLGEPGSGKEGPGGRGRRDFA